MTQLDASHLIRKIASTISVDPSQAWFWDVQEAIESIAPSSREMLLKLCDARRQHPELLKDQDVTRSMAVVLVSLLPKSAHSIRNILCNLEGKMLELHFSLFCMLDCAPEIPRAEKFALEVPLLVQDYLMNIRSEAAFAAWMAGDLLGDHWEPKTALPVLLKVAREGRFVAGRLGALHGLDHLRDHMAPASWREIVGTLLHEMRRTDRSKDVRWHANHIFNGRGCVQAHS